ncbi:MAG: UTP--glucose-1-phosphate uridylyltransferase GalU [Xanthomonadales bacterium]|nr:UTP--glucose-1-phosphate uridylyltransferase GalU [Gammaproteobacteria bacterium]MBT8049676.1 UTP--glucose-1-phosphate uridylyltransferase GalU [Gammaproteobacteria bacterium]MBT8056624.1 UTP--glucose-1-phosphate uridylyltransferase GalU [Gammaproteobacteria bacterium]NNL03886.1 UTP--glucose-1-phosphate uridylyltransferase GalU [Xanthomonadales bacterium]
MPRKIRKAVFPVAGLGTRFLPATKSIPKEMLPIVDKPLIQYAVEEALEAGIETLIFISSTRKHTIYDHFSSDFELETRLSHSGKPDLLDRITDIVPDRVDRVYVTQTEALGLGHAILCAESVIGDEPFAILLADDMVKNKGAGALSQMVGLYEETGSSVIGVEEVPPERTKSYGIVGVDDTEAGHQAIHTMVEKPLPEDAPSNLGIIGRYVLDPSVFRHLHSVGKGSGGEIQLTDGIAAMLETRPVLALALQGERYDCGSRHGFIEATIKYAMEHDDMRDDVLDHMFAVLKSYGRI